jgi:hypothetical protein
MREDRFTLGGDLGDEIRAPLGKNCQQAAADVRVGRIGREIRIARPTEIAWIDRETRHRKNGGGLGEDRDL